jgi:putative tricarboxylic transport membrane protein
MYSAFFDGLGQLASPEILVFLFVGVAIGWVFGIFPGLGPISAMAIMLPVTFGWDPTRAMFLFAGIMGSVGQAGSITSILLNIPGTAQNAATCFDGFPLTRQGKAAWALGISASSSVLGALFGVGVLLIAIPLIRPILFAFGPAEKLWIVIFGLVALALALPGSIIKGLAAGSFGILLTFIGLGGAQIAVPRFTLGSNYLYEGLGLVPILIGLLVGSEAVVHLVDGVTRRGSSTSGVAPQVHSQARLADYKEALSGLLVPFKYPITLIRSSGIGTLIGIIPGVGGTVAQFVSYNATVLSSRHPETFGKGDPEGLVAADGAINAKDGGTLLPTLAFGLPGNGEMALLLGALILYGVQPGPFFLRDHIDLAWALILGLVAANIIGSMLTIGSVGLLSKVPTVDTRYIAPIVIIFALTATLAITGNIWDPAAAFAAAIFGYMLRRNGFPVIAMVIGFVLGSIAEQSYYTAIQSARGSYGIFFQSGISLSIMSLTLAAVAIRLYTMFRKTARTKV